MMRVANMISPRSGRPVANQFIITDCGRTLFQSYESPIVEINFDNLTITVYPDYDYSATTAKYRNEFMSEQGFGKMANKKDFERYMNEGKIYGFAIIKEF